MCVLKHSLEVGTVALSDAEQPGAALRVARVEHVTPVVFPLRKWSQNLVSRIQALPSQRHMTSGAVAVAHWRRAVETIPAHLLHSFPPLFRLKSGFFQRLFSCSASALQARQAAANAWRQAADGVSRNAEPLGDSITESLAERCAAGLKHVRGISTTYRMVARPAPTRPSHYVPGVFAPLRC